MLDRHISIIEEAIGFTNMAKPKDQLNLAYNYIVHVADLLLNGLKNEELIVEGTKKVYLEFMVEAYEISKITDEKVKIEKFNKEKLDNIKPANMTPNKWNHIMMLACSSTIGGTYQSQPGFNAYVGTFKDHLVEKLKIGKGFDLIEYYNKNIEINNQLFKLFSQYADNLPLKLDETMKETVQEKFNTIKNKKINLSFYKNKTINDLCENTGTIADFSTEFLYDGVYLNVNTEYDADKPQSAKQNLLMI